MKEQTETESRAFTELTKKLLAVPKEEVDKEKAKYEKQREEEKRSKES
jgi:hypothetical protein